VCSAVGELPLDLLAVAIQPVRELADTQLPRRLFVGGPASAIARRTHKGSLRSPRWSLTGRWLFGSPPCQYLPRPIGQNELQSAVQQRRAPVSRAFISGSDGTRTRDLRRDGRGRGEVRGAF
jgi:hypothetical protein